ncbi:hypothetical protein KJ599_00205 [bacterium]|nr:hypothetical protein [bacterium]
MAGDKRGVGAEMGSGRNDMEKKGCITIALIVVLFLAIFSFDVFADTIYLKNKKTLEGDIVEETGKGVWLKIKDVGKLFLDYSEIENIEKLSPEEKERKEREEQEFINQQKSKGLIQYGGAWITEQEKEQLLIEKAEREKTKKKALQEKYEREVIFAQKLNAIREHRVIVGMTSEDVFKSVGNPYEREGDIKTRGAWIYGVETEETTGLANVGRDKTTGSVVGFPVTEWFFIQTLKVYFSAGEVVEVDNSRIKYQ